MNNRKAECNRSSMHFWRLPVEYNHFQSGVVTGHHVREEE